MAKEHCRQNPIRALAIGAFVLAQGIGAQPWSFGILADTQWPREAWYVPADSQGNPLVAADGSDSIVVVSVDSIGGWKNPHTVAADFIHQIHGRFRQHGVKLVVATGDLADESTLDAIHSRATWAQELFESGIGFFPVRGNHDATAEVAAAFVRLFPQTRDGIQRRISSGDALWTDSAQLHPFRNAQAESFAMGTGFSSPVGAEGRSYAFHFNGATFALLDPFPGPDGVVLRASQQLGWLDSVLASRPANTPAFVFCHYPLLGINHAEHLFGNSPAYDTASQNTFIRLLRQRGVRVYVAGHDHILQHSLVASASDPGERIEQIILSGASFKFYPPSVPSVDELYNLPEFGRSREVPLAQDLGQIGYVVAKVDGSRVEFEAWGAPSGILAGEIFKSMDLTGKWTVRRRWGWSETGKGTLVEPGGSYRSLSDSALGTSAKILWGASDASRRDAIGRLLSQWITTDWTRHGQMASASWTLWGMEREEGSMATAPFAISLRLDPGAVDAAMGKGDLGLLRMDSTLWRFAGSGPPQIRAWEPTDTIVGSHGVDTLARSVWAVLDRAGTFAAGKPGAVNIQEHRQRRGDPMARCLGRKLILPEAWKGSPVTVEARSVQGEKIGSWRVSGGALDLPTALRGAVWIRCRTEGQTGLVQRVVFPL
ncbi:MAG: metallophosphoesterase [Fibrobacterota bacterium]|nr:metallophosphoesterase [Fibrobacterota bacterium]QQS06747.1 MAG: metallophosphoesterase [Fibrobacterota bacterium]